MAPDAVAYDPEDLESPMAHEAQNSVCLWLCSAHVNGRPNLPLVRQRIAFLRSYMEVVYGELEHCDCEICQGVAS